jgi:hypothetical protein
MWHAQSQGTFYFYAMSESALDEPLSLLYPVFPATATSPLPASACLLASCYLPAPAGAAAAPAAATAIPAGVFDFKQSRRIKEGDTLPLDESLLVLEEGSSEPKAVTLKELVGGKRAVLFGLPGM